jgi:hypothetical protein
MNGTKGSNGTSCFIASDVDGVVTLQCGEGDNSKTTKLYKAMCGTKPYDPEVRTCENQVLWGKCGDGKINEETQFCGDDGKPYDLCGGKPYDTETRTCEGGKIIGKCGEKTYNVATEVCHDDANSEVWKLCGTVPYDPKTKVCDEKTNTIIDKVLEKCGANTYDPDNEFCDDREGENVIYKKITVTGFDYFGSSYSATWMAENLRYKPSTEGSLCRDDDDSDYFYSVRCIMIENND